MNMFGIYSILPGVFCVVWLVSNACLGHRDLFIPSRWILALFHGRMRLRVLAFAAGFFLSTRFAAGQTVDFTTSRVPMAQLAGPWRFHTGDDPSWAGAAFDDSAWSLLNADKGWSGQGYAGYGGMALYRLLIKLPVQHGPLALYIPSVDGSCQIFGNGRLIGQVGNMPPRPQLVQEGRILFRIPDDAANSSRLLLALRVWAPPYLAGSVPGGLHPAPRIGDVNAIAQWRRLEGRELYWANSRSMIELFANFVGALAILGLSALRRKESEYLWFGLYLLNWSMWNASALYSTFHPVPYFSTRILEDFLVATGYYFAVEFFRTLCEQKRSWLFSGGVLFATAFGLFLILDAFQPQSGWLLDYFWAWAGLHVCLAFICYNGWRAGSRDAPILLLTEAYLLPEAVVSLLAATSPFAQQAWAQVFRSFQNGIHWPFPYWVPSLLGDLTNVVVLIVLIRRFARSRRDEERLELELEAARTVQKVLIPDEVPTIPGFQVQAVYKPASQVGGDFFQIIATQNGGALIVVGDVSGKGMPAAMTVSLLVGTFRTLAHYTQRPGEILAAMNQRMLARSGGGFTTCLVLRLDTDGTLTAANAGHLAPYIDGKELTLENGLPLGLSADASCRESQFALSTASQLTLITDGIVEARNPAGELFGFERTAFISAKTADQIAKTAELFGQEDDITVLTLQFAPVEVLHAQI